jgi:hypothetical protein
MRYLVERMLERTTSFSSSLKALPALVIAAASAPRNHGDDRLLLDRGDAIAALVLGGDLVGLAQIASAIPRTLAASSSPLVRLSAPTAPWPRARQA